MPGEKPGATVPAFDTSACTVPVPIRLPVLVTGPDWNVLVESTVSVPALETAPGAAIVFPSARCNSPPAAFVAKLRRPSSDPSLSVPVPWSAMVAALVRTSALVNCSVPATT